MLTLGWLNPHHLVGGGLEIDAEAAARTVGERIAAVLGKDVLDAAHGILEVACGTMMRAVKAVSTYRGRDPRDFALFAFGGNGPVVAAAIADLLEMTTVVVPPNPGVFSAYGLLLSDIEQEAARSHLALLSDTGPAALDVLFRDLEAGLASEMAAEGYGAGDYAVRRIAELRYEGQAHELAVPVASGPDGMPDTGAMAAAFGDEHERTYGHRADAEAVESVTLRAVATVAVEKPAPQPKSGEGAAAGARPAFFGAPAGRQTVPVVAREGLTAAPRNGPLIVEEYDATCVVPPGWTARLDAAQNIVLEKGSVA